MRYKNNFKIVGYYFGPGKLDRIQYDALTHINFAFAIPTKEGTLRPLENSKEAKEIIIQAHKHNITVNIAVGGWSYNDKTLESTFVEATNTDDKIQRFVDSIIGMVNEYGFDGVDMDWEYPRAGEPSQDQYEKMMLLLSRELKKQGKLLTVAVISGVNPKGVPQSESNAHTDEVLQCVDWINVMAYDGEDGEGHSPYEFAINCGLHWRDNHKLPPKKIVLGVPFYARPSWASYEEILKKNPDGHNSDEIIINGLKAYYNGIPTIRKKTAWAKENLGGIMIWELSHDTLDKSKSLLSAIGDEAK